MLRPFAAFSSQSCLAAAFVTVTIFCSTMPSFAQDQPAAATAAVHSWRGTVSAVAGSKVTVTVDNAAPIQVTVPANARILQLAPGSTDLKTATPATVADIVSGDRVLVSGKPGDADAVMAIRIVLIKSTAIAERNAASEADWQHRGSGGIVTAVDPASGTVTVTLRGRKIQLTTTPSTIFRRYSAGSVKFEDATVGKLSDIRAGDQLRVRGDKSDDGSTIKAEEIVSGSFSNVAGTVTAVNASASTITVKDLAAKKDLVVHLGANSDLRNLPPEMAARFAARGHAAGGASAGANGNAGNHPSAENASAQTEPRRGPGGGGGAGDLSQLIPRLPTTTVADLKPGAAIMIVASSGADSTLTAITVLTGVESILAATPSGGQPLTLSPINMGAMEGAGGMTQ